MYKYALTISLSLLTTIGLAQNNHLDYKYGLKVYNLTSFEKNTKLTILDDVTGLSSEYTKKSLQILHPTIAIQWKSKKNNFHEVELTSLMFGKFSTKETYVQGPTDAPQIVLGRDVTRTEISMRYEFVLNFNKSKDRKLVPSIGFGVNPYFKQSSSVPKTANLFPSSEKHVGVKGFVTPRLTYFMTSKLFLDLNLPFCVMDSYVLASQESNPTIPIGDQTATTFNFKRFPKQFSGRIGVGLKL